MRGLMAKAILGDRRRRRAPGRDAGVASALIGHLLDPTKGRVTSSLVWKNFSAELEGLALPNARVPAMDRYLYRADRDVGTSTRSHSISGRMIYETHRRVDIKPPPEC